MMNRNLNMSLSFIGVKNSVNIMYCWVQILLVSDLFDYILGINLTIMDSG